MQKTEFPSVQVSRHGVYYFRMRLGSADVRKSLNTKSRSLAALIAYRMEIYKRMTTKKPTLDELTLQLENMTREALADTENIRRIIKIEQDGEKSRVDKFDLRMAPDGSPILENIKPGEEIAAAAAFAQIARMEGGITARVSADEANAPSLGQLIEQHRQTLHGKDPKSVDDRISIIRAFLSHSKTADDQKPHTVKESEARAFMTSLIAANRSPSRRNTILSALNAFFEEQTEAHYIRANPFANIKRAKKMATNNEDEHPFTGDQLQAIFASEHYPREQRTGKKPGYYWVPIIMYVTGARPNEISQARLCDFEYDKDTLTLRITAESDYQSVKTAASVRKSRLRLIGQFLWIFNKDPALRVKRPMPQLG